MNAASFEQVFLGTEELVLFLAVQAILLVTPNSIVAMDSNVQQAVQRRPTLIRQQSILYTVAQVF
jgi:hypothetical protein